MNHKLYAKQKTSVLITKQEKKKKIESKKRKLILL